MTQPHGTSNAGSESFVEFVYNLNMQLQFTSENNIGNI
jgi:hypothetical protein